MYITQQNMVEVDYIIRDLLAELERVEKIAEPTITGKVIAELTRLNQRIAELELEKSVYRHNSPKLALAGRLFWEQGCRQQAARECVEIIDKYPAFLFGTDAVGVKLNLSQGIKAHFAIKGY